MPSHKTSPSEAKDILSNIAGSRIADLHGQPSLPTQGQAQADRFSAGEYDSSYIPPSESLRERSSRVNNPTGQFAANSIAGMTTQEESANGENISGGRINQGEWEKIKREKKSGASRL
jgi:hypothetical protein